MKLRLERAQKVVDKNRVKKMGLFMKKLIAAIIITINMMCILPVSASEVCSCSTDFTIIADSLGTGGSISPSGVIRAARGSSQTFTFTPSLFCEVDSIKINGMPVNIMDSYTINNIDSDLRIEVTFKLDDAKFLPVYCIISAPMVFGAFCEIYFKRLSNRY